MSRGKWTIRVAARIEANPRAVVSWYRHPDRIEEVLAGLVARGVTDCSVERSFTDSVRILDIRFTTPRGSTNYTRNESQLGPDGQVGSWSGDRFMLIGHTLIQQRSVAER